MSTRVSATVVTTATRVPPHRRAAKGSRSAVVASATRHGDGDDGRVDRAADVVVVGRRTALGMGASALMSASPLAARAEDADPWEGSYVKPALTVPQYLDKIATSRGPAFEELRELTDQLKFSQLNNALVIAPFDDVRQSAYFLPWALVKLDEDAGVAAQRRWLDFRERLIQLDETSIDAGRREADETDVGRCVDRLEAALDELIAAVPTSRR